MTRKVTELTIFVSGCASRISPARFPRDNSPSALISQISGLALASVDDRVGGPFCREHGVILIVVAMHPVAPDRIEIVELVQVIADDVELPVFAEIGRISLGHAVPPFRRVRPRRLMRSSFTSSSAAKSMNYPSRMDHSSSPSRQKYSKPSQIVSGSATKAGLQLLNICSRPIFTSGSCT